MSNMTFVCTPTRIFRDVKKALRIAAMCRCEWGHHPTEDCGELSSMRFSDGGVIENTPDINEWYRVGWTDEELATYGHFKWEEK